MPDIFLRSGEANPADVRLRDTTLADSASFDSTASWVQAAATWAAAETETFAATATFDQIAATWAATASEAFTATGSFSQAAATWAALVSETFASTATWTQAAATWDAAVDQTSDRTSTASWEQATASWDALATGPLATGGTGGRFGPIVRVFTQPKPVPAAELVAAFAQSPASWAANAQINDDELVLLLAA